VPGIRASCFIAVDDFGAEVLGTYLDILQEAGNEDLIYQSRFFWAGLEDRPRVESYWENTVPVWTTEDPADEPFRWDLGEEKAPEPSTGMAGGDDPLLGFIRKTTQGDGFRWLIDEYLPSEFGHAELDSIHIILVGSFGTVGTHAIVQGFLAGIAESRSIPFSLDPQEYVIAGIGHLTADGKPDKLARARAGSSLLQLQEYFQASNPQVSAAMVCVVHEQVGADAGTVLDRRSQVVIGSSIALGMAAEAGRPLLSGENHPFRLKKMHLQHKVEWSNPDYPYNPGESFAYCGASAVHFRAMVLDRILSTRFLEDMCSIYASNDPDGETPSLEDGSGQNSVVDQIIQDTSEMSVEELRSLKLVDETSFFPWSFDGAESIATHILDRIWKETHSIFSDKLFSKLPLEDWDQTLEELSEFVDSGLVSRMKESRPELKKRLISIFDGGLEASFRRVSRVSWNEDIDFAPRANCRKALVCMDAQAEEALKECHEQYRMDHLNDAEIESIRSEIPKARKRIREVMDQIPAPQALIFRAVGALSAFILLGLSIPFDLGFFDSWLMRVVLGLLPAVIILGRSWIKLLGARKELMDALHEWIEKQRRYHEAKQREERYETIQVILLEFQRYVRWLLASEDDSSKDFPFDENLPWANEAIPEFPRKRKRFLHHFGETMENARDGWKALRKEMINTLRSAKNVIYVPPVFRGELDFSNLPVRPPEIYLNGARSEDVREELGGLEITSHGEMESLWLLGTGRDVFQMWFEDAQIPSGEELISQEVRQNSPSFQLLEAMAKHVSQRWKISLQPIIKERMAKQRSQGVTPDLVEHMNRTNGVVWFNQKIVQVALATSESDPLAHAMQVADSIVISNEFHCCLNVALPVSGDDLTYIGGIENPKTFLGQATKSALHDHKKP